MSNHQGERRERTEILRILLRKKERRRQTHRKYFHHDGYSRRSSSHLSIDLVRFSLGFSLSVFRGRSEHVPSRLLSVSVNTDLYPTNIRLSSVRAQSVVLNQQTTTTTMPVCLSSVPSMLSQGIALLRISPSRPTYGTISVDERARERVSFFHLLIRA